MFFITSIAILITIGIGHGIAYTSLIGLAPALAYLTSVIKYGDFECEPNKHLIATVAVWVLCYVLLIITGPFAGIIIIFYGLAYLMALYQNFLLTFIVTIIVGFIYEVIDGRITIT